MDPSKCCEYLQEINIMKKEIDIRSKYIEFMNYVSINIDIKIYMKYPEFLKELMNCLLKNYKYGSKQYKIMTKKLSLGNRSIYKDRFGKYEVIDKLVFIKYKKAWVEKYFKESIGC